MKHSKNQLPVAFGCALLVNVPVWQRITVAGAPMNLATISNAALLHEQRQFIDHAQRCVSIVFGKAAINLAFQLDNKKVRRVAAIGNQARNWQFLARGRLGLAQAVRDARNRSV